jgi:hypothetical protein
MALQKTTKTPHGFTAADAYHRVEGVSIVEKTKISFQVRCYKDALEAVSFSDNGYECSYDSWTVQQPRR